ncbi:MAG TPA: hypothetical protein PK926_14155 [Spirochaetota bacterium]|nr:hypothetical protein [Spirochaetota bacterium]HPI90123.1 hypothetical protein [Spirochaetota bacterium]HPR49161.1 hypothetical protein [Spirochaetota bacterium]
MKNSEKKPKVVPLDWVDESDHWILAPGTELEKRRRRIKEITHRKKNCLFAAGVPLGMHDFIYRAVKALKLDDRTLIFSRGMVRAGHSRVKYSVSIQELDWGAGTLITIPRLLKFREIITVIIENREHRLRAMELALLRGLLGLAFTGKNNEYYPAMAALVLAQGWKGLDNVDLPKIYLK